MKKILALLLTLITLVSLAACAEETAPTKTEEPVTVEESEKEEKETKEERKYDRVDTPLTPERVAAIPIAREGMSADELRQICIDYVRLSVTFQWVPNRTFDYEARQNGGTPVHFDEGKLHGGMPYINTASGNLYRMLEFCDPETGIMDVEYLEKNTKIFGTACSGTTGWGWARVVNSAVCGWTSSLNAAHGLVPVGPYTYDLSIVTYGADGNEDAKDIARRNGEQVMYESYALSQKADCFVNNGHVRMNGKDPVVVRNEDGTINGKKSYIVQVEQGLFTTGTYHKRVSADGVRYDIQGNEGVNADGTDFYYTFEDLYEKGYLPHTFKEFLGTDPIEPAQANIGYTEGTITGEQLRKCIFKSNYVVSDIFTTVRDPEGKQLARYTYRHTNHFHFEVSLKKAIPETLVKMFSAGGQNTVEITAQLGNGEIVTAYTGTLAG
ncbi:MAG: hypothetical protein IKD18_02930 [Clostridia bacterium]|nr:hypothetical protein [Clostridia bacterium]